MVLSAKLIYPFYPASGLPIGTLIASPSLTLAIDVHGILATFSPPETPGIYLFPWSNVIQVETT